MPPRAPSPPPPSAPERPGTVVRTLRRELWHEGVLRRPGEVVELCDVVAAVLEPEGVFTPLPSRTQET